VGMTALVSGCPERVGAVSEAVERAGFDVLTADDPERIRQVCADLGPGAVDCYIQLPHLFAPRQGRVVEQVGDFLTQGLLARFASTAAVLPSLRFGASVVLVPGHQPPAQLPDDPPARRQLLAVLARAVAVETAPLGIRTIVVGPDHSPAGIAEVARSGGATAGPGLSPYHAGGQDGSYDDWRREIFSLFTPPSDTYLSQPNPEDYGR
jgi:hypothetical protein